MDTRIKNLSKGNSYLNQILYELRDEQVQQDRMRFRNNLEKTGMLLAYEISKEMSYVPQSVTTQLGTLEIPLLESQPVILSILRAGIPFHQGFLKLLDHADNGFISAYRLHTHGNEFVVKVEYMASPDLSGRSLILVDPMIATGKSIVKSYQSIIERGEPSNVYIAGVVGSEEGLLYVLRHIPKARIFVGAIDHELTARSYIVPGLGDAGDLAYGPK